MHNASEISVSYKNDSSGLLLTPLETATYLGVSERTLSVWRCTKRYDIPYIKVGRLVKYRKTALDAFLCSRTCNGEG